MTFNDQYLTYLEYKELGGTLTEMPFNLLEFNARKEIDNKSFGRLKNLTSQIEEVKMCDYELITLINSYSNNNISSENTDGYSISYNNKDNNERNKEISDIINSYLGECYLDDGTPYLYSGVNCL